ncbi:MAG: sigma-E factor negative regulatory protein [Gammaproteobacteria bacterium]|nr:sigma-E factor negative regulatory protein [Gammaproteobacteria bacterium]
MSTNKQVNESLSALMDGESDAREQKHILNLMAESEQVDLKLRWGRYHLISDGVQGDVPLLSTNFAASVRDAIDNEPAILAPRALRTILTRSTLLKGVAGFAIAASVALVSIVGLRSLQNEVGVDQQLAEQSQPLMLLQPRQDVRLVAAPLQGTRWNLHRSAIEKRLNGYLATHTEHTVLGEVQGVVPYSRLAGYDQ